jgi:hypothetical protein
VKGRLTQIDANRMYLHADDPPCRSCHHHPSTAGEESSGGPSH